jgi:hypothetical protein
MPGNDAGEEALIESATVERVARTASTNDDLLARVRAAAAAGATEFAPCLLVADAQTAGRGRSGRRWHSEPGRSLTLSLAWQPRRADLGGLSLAVGAASPMRSIRRTIRSTPRRGSASSGRTTSGSSIAPAAPCRTAADASSPASSSRRRRSAPGRVAVIGVGVNIAAHAVRRCRIGSRKPRRARSHGDRGVDARAHRACAEGGARALRRPRIRRVRRALRRARRPARAQRRRGETARSPGRGGNRADGALLVDIGGRIVAVTSGEWRLRIAAETERSC